MLPMLKYAANDRENITESFIGGINRREYYKPGDIFNTENMSSEEFPVLMPRKKRKTIVRTEGEINGFGSGEKLYYSVSSGDGISAFYYDGNLIEGLNLSAGEKSFVNLGDYIIIHPDMMYYFTGKVDGTFVSGENDALYLLDQAMLTADIEDGDYYEADGEIYMYNSNGTWNAETKDSSKFKRLALTRNATSRWVFMGKRFGKLTERHSKGGISLGDVFVLDDTSETDGLFVAIAQKHMTDIKAGDSVRIFCKNETDKYSTYKKVKRIYYNSYKDVESDVFVFDFDEDLKAAIESATEFTIEREIPKLDGLFECNMRLWGYEGDSIYASSLGNPFSWSTYYNDLEAWSIDTETSGEITAGCNFDGYPLFFKEDYIFKVTGGLPSDFSLSITPSPGMGCIDEKSIVSGGGRIYYLSPEGFAAYTGLMPQIISEELGDKFKAGSAGFDGRNYYVTAKSRNGSIDVLVYDTEKGIWIREDGRDFEHYTFFENVLYGADANEIVAVGEHGFEDADEEIVSSFVEFTPFNEVFLEKKALKNISFRIKTERGASVRIWKKEGDTWRELKNVPECYDGTIFMRIMPRRGDYYSIKISGEGDYIIYAMSRSYEIHSKKG